eukprot:scaffold2910_cov390-Prasinococcus_capsulatus_cf.AAC.62
MGPPRTLPGPLPDRPSARRLRSGSATRRPARHSGIARARPTRTSHARYTETYGLIMTLK